jgi:hypothetical protein
VALFKDRVPPSVKITLAMDGRILKTATLDSTRTRDVVAIESPASDAKGTHTWSVSAEPPVPGLGFSFTLMTWVPWKEESTPHGLDLSIEVPTTMDAGKAVTVGIVASAPAGMPLTIVHALPAGAQPDTAGLDLLQSTGTIASYRVEEGAISLSVPAIEAGKTFSASYRVIPTLSGTLHSGASYIASSAQPNAVYHVRPALWTVR